MTQTARYSDAQIKVFVMLHNQRMAKERFAAETCTSEEDALKEKLKYLFFQIAFLHHEQQTYLTKTQCYNWMLFSNTATQQKYLSQAQAAGFVHFVADARNSRKFYVKPTEKLLLYVRQVVIDEMDFSRKVLQVVLEAGPLPDDGRPFGGFSLKDMQSLAVA